MSLYTYIPKENTAKTDGLLSTRLAPKGWEKYIDRTSKNTKEEVLAALDSWKPGFKRSNGISVFSEPIGPNADPEMLEFAHAKQLVKLPSAKALLLAKIIKRIEATNTGNRRGTHTVKDTSHKPIYWANKKPGKFLFSNVPHYILETTNGRIPPEYIELVKQPSKEDNARDLIREIKELAKKRGLNVFAVTDGASGISNNGNPAVRAAREAHMKWELEHGSDPYEDWGSRYK